MFDALLEIPLLTSVNHVLRRENWARAKLAPFAHKRIAIHVGNASVAQLRIDAAGLIERGGGAEPADLRIAVPPGALPGLLLRQPEALNRLELEGDMALAQALQFLLLNLRWDAEEDLARWVGDAAAHRMAQGARDLRAWGEQAALRFGENVAQYLQEEQNALPQADEVRDFVAQVAALRDDIARLAARVRRHENE